MPKKSKIHKNKKDSPSMNKGAQNKGQGKGSGKADAHWQQDRNENTGNTSEYWKQGPQNGSGNPNGNLDQLPDMGTLTKTGCLPTAWARTKNAFKRSASGGCLLQLSILLLPLLAVGAILLITL